MADNITRLAQRGDYNTWALKAKIHLMAQGHWAVINGDDWGPPYLASIDLGDQAYIQNTFVYYDLKQKFLIRKFMASAAILDLLDATLKKEFAIEELDVYPKELWMAIKNYFLRNR